QGSADAIFQSLNLIHDDQPDYVVVFGADHVYRMDVSQMVEAHIAGGAGVTVAGIRMPRSQASSFGVIKTGADGLTIRAFLEKPADPPGLPDSPDETFVSMGNYVFSTDALLDALRMDADDEGSVHDMGGSIIPMLTDKGDAQVYDFADNDVPGTTERDRSYWRDVGTLDSYHEAHTDLVSVDPVFNLYNTEWPIYTSPPQLPGAKLVQGGHATESILSTGSIVAGGAVDHAVLSPGVRILRGAEVVNSVILDGTVVGEGAVVRDAILDKNIVVPPGAQIGVDHEHDRARGFTVSDDGITVLGKGQRLPD
ncbi:MAG TPA: sugar phosphate nucleotidyltransferase, partial [Actinopolymorphaceae bacterium]|nr:sugar phosphate nucleotidyltransferase [Actinopolymorphaceae bacterium]